MVFTDDQRLVFAARAGNLDEVEALIAGGADPNGPQDDPGSPLLAAIAAHHSDVVTALLRNGASTKVADWFGDGPLEYALHHQDDASVFELLGYGATLQARVKDTFKVLLSQALKRRGS